MKYFTIMTLFLRIGILKDVYKKSNKRLFRGLNIYCAMVILADIQINDVSVLLDFLFQNLKQLILEIQLKMADQKLFAKSKCLSKA